MATKIEIKFSDIETVEFIDSMPTGHGFWWQGKWLGRFHIVGLSDGRTGVVQYPHEDIIEYMKKTPHIAETAYVLESKDILFIRSQIRYTIKRHNLAIRAQRKLANLYDVEKTFEKGFEPDTPTGMQWLEIRREIKKKGIYVDVTKRRTSDCFGPSWSHSEYMREVSRVTIKPKQ